MQDLSPLDKDFLAKIETLVNENIANEDFGVLELAEKVGMSRSNLLRKIKRLTGLSVSQYIRIKRLDSAVVLLKEESFSVSEISYKVGFSSPSYFIKCFREHFGYPPGELIDRLKEQNQIKESNENKASQNRKTKIWLLSAVFALLTILSVLILKNFLSADTTIDKSIAVLPFKNDSADSTNVYVVNGLMESLLSDLQKIKQLRVVSRTSVEKYRRSNKTIGEIAKELGVTYIVEGSGQKINNTILLHVQLIDAKKDKHLWAKKYKRQIKDIFELQGNVAKSITNEIKVVVTPKEIEQITKVETNSPIAYDYYLRGVEFFHLSTKEGLDSSIVYFKDAIRYDEEFARAYADVAISYYYLDVFLKEKQYADSINYYSDKALLFDSKLPQSLLAKAFYYMNTAQNKQALPYLEKALEYNPNSALIINTLSDFYTNRIPDKHKYLEYALKGVRLNVGANDSVTTSYIYLHIANALIQSGFVKEAKEYINTSLDYNPNNIFSEYVKAYIIYAEEKDLSKTRNHLKNTIKKDTTRLDVLQELAKVCYFMRDYSSAYNYYKRFLNAKRVYNLNIFPAEDLKIAIVYDKVGQKETADSLLNTFFYYAQNDKSLYKNLNLAAYYSYKNEQLKALEYLKQFSEEEGYYYWIILFLEEDPLVDNIKELSDFKEILKKMEDSFREKHQEIRSKLDSEGLLSLSF